MHKSPIFLLFLLPSLLSAAIRSGTGEWRADGYAKVLYDTPLGRLYQLQPNQGDGACIGCRGCVERCPFGVPVAERMKKAAALFG